MINGDDIVAKEFDDAAHLAREGAATLAELQLRPSNFVVRSTLAWWGPGSTPKAMYALLAGEAGGAASTGRRWNRTPGGGRHTLGAS